MGISFFLNKPKKKGIQPLANPYPSRFLRLRRRLSLSASVVISIGIIGLVSLYKPVRSALVDFAFDGIVLTYYYLTLPVENTKKLLSDVWNLSEIRKQNNQLLEENSYLKGRITEFKTLAKENHVLRHLAKVPTEQAGEIITARVLAAPHDGFHNSFIVSAGYKDNIEKGMPVWVTEGAVGRISQVGKYVSRVMILTDSNCRIPVETESGQKAILAGDGSAYPLLVYVSYFDNLKQGDRLLTSGVGGVFPSGIFVGTIRSISHNVIRVQPAVQFEKQQFVHILFQSINYHKEIKRLLEK